MQHFGKKVIKSLAVATLLVIMLVSPVLAALFSADIMVQETTGATYGMLGIRVPTNVSWWATNGYIDADGRDTRVKLGSAEQPHMLQDNNVFFASPVVGSSSTAYQLTTNETAQDMAIVPGYDGYITAADNTTLELGDNFTIEQSGWVDTTNGTDKNLVYKAGAFRTYVSGTGNITSEIAALWVSPNAFTDPDSEWTNEPDAYDSNFATYAIAGNANHYLNFTFPSASYMSSKVRVYASTHLASDPGISVDVYYSGGWHNIYSGSITANTWVELPVGSVQSISSISVERITTTLWIKEIQLQRDTVSVTAPISSSNHTVTTSANTTHLLIAVDGISINSTALAGANVTNNNNPWYWMQNNVMPYADIITLSVNGTPQLYYQPNAIIAGATLPDRETATNNDGTFVFGTNPTGIAVSIGSFDIIDQPVTVGLEIATPDTLDIVTAPPTMVLEDFEMTMSGNEFYPYVSWLAGVTMIDVPMLWWYLSALMSISGMALFHKYLRNIWITGFTTAGIGWFVVSMSGLEWWVPVPVVLATLFIGLWKRSAEV